MSRWEQEEAERQAYEAHMQAMYDEQCRMQQLEEENEQLKADLAALSAAVGQACVAASLSAGETLTDPMQHIIVSTVTRLRAEALAQREQERAAVVTWLREVAETMNHNGDKCCGRVEDLASAVERGEHRREGER